MVDNAEMLTSSIHHYQSFLIVVLGVSVSVC